MFTLLCRFTNKLVLEEMCSRLRGLIMWVMIISLILIWGFLIWIGGMLGFWDFPMKTKKEMQQMRSDFWELFTLKVPTDDEDDF